MLPVNCLVTKYSELLYFCFNDLLQLTHSLDFHLILCHGCSQDEELEQFSINYVSYSGNKISYIAVMRYLCWVLLKHREPLVIKVC